MQDDKGQLTILIVDDDPGIRALLVRIISDTGHQAVPAESAEDILKLLPFWTFHAAFIDQNLPGMDGLMLAQFLRKNNADMAIVIVTGMVDSQLEYKAQQAGLGFLKKPFLRNHVLAIIEDYVLAMAQKEAEPESRDTAQIHAPIADYADQLTDFFDMPRVSERIAARLVESIHNSLNTIKADHRYNERDRVCALAGLITARVLGVPVPKISPHLNCFEEYDAIMRHHGYNPEFSGKPGLD